MTAANVPTPSDFSPVAASASAHEHPLHTVRASDPCESPTQTSKSDSWPILALNSKIVLQKAGANKKGVNFVPRHEFFACLGPNDDCWHASLGGPAYTLLSFRRPPVGCLEVLGRQSVRRGRSGMPVSRNTAPHPPPGTPRGRICRLSLALLPALDHVLDDFGTAAPMTISVTTDFALALIPLPTRPSRVTPIVMRCVLLIAAKAFIVVDLSRRCALLRALENTKGICIGAEIQGTTATR